MSERSHIGHEPSRISGRQPEHMFGLVEDHDVEEHMGLLHEVIERGDVSRMRELLQDRQMVEQILMRKGPGGAYLNALDQAMSAIVAECGISDPRGMTIDDIDTVIREGQVDPMLFAQWGNAQYHLRDDRRAMHLGQMIATADRLPTLVRANAMNLMGSLSDRHAHVAQARQWNRDAATLLRQDASDDPNVKWQRLKIEHGLLIQRSRDRVFPDMIGQFETIVDQRKALGDVVHVPRAYMDMGDIAHRLGSYDQALVYLTQALEGLEAVGYDTAAVHAADKLARLRQDMGADRRAKHVWSHGIGIGERMSNLLDQELEEMKEKRDKALKRPAVCLIGLGDDNFLIEQIGEGNGRRYMCVAVDQQRSAKAESIVRDKIQAILTHVGGQDVSLSRRVTGMFVRGKGKLDDGRKYALYSVDVAHAAGVSEIVEAGLDKTPKDGYTMMSWSELSKQKNLFDAQSRALIDAEESWRQQQE